MLLMHLIFVIAFVIKMSVWVMLVLHEFVGDNTKQKRTQVQRNFHTEN